MAAVYSKSFLYTAVSPGTPVSFMTGPSSETWIIRNILLTGASSSTNWNMEITDQLGNLIYATPPYQANPTVVQPLRGVLMPATSYTVSVSGETVFVAIDGYVLTAA